MEIDMPRGVPGNAVGIKFKSHSGDATYWVWQPKKSASWYWHATGVEGEEPTFEKACAAARRRIRDGEFERLT